VTSKLAKKTSRSLKFTRIESRSGKSKSSSWAQAISLFDGLNMIILFYWLVFMIEAKPDLNVSKLFVLRSGARSGQCAESCFETAHEVVEHGLSGPDSYDRGYHSRSPSGSGPCTLRWCSSKRRAACLCWHGIILPSALAWRALISAEHRVGAWPAWRRRDADRECAAAASVKAHQCNWQGYMAGPAPLAAAERPDGVQWLV
jgi:hypothetical protein